VIVPAIDVGGGDYMATATTGDEAEATPLAAREPIKERGLGGGTRVDGSGRGSQLVTTSLAVVLD
jgi:hypothetical protein